MDTTQDNQKGIQSGEELASAVEAVLFTRGQKVSYEELARSLHVPASDIAWAGKILKERFEKRHSGLQVQIEDDSLQLTIGENQYENLVRIAKVPKKQVLSEGCLETLSVIAYRQPITRQEVEEIRGLSCSYAIERLVKYDLIEAAGRRKDLKGHPIQYKTTDTFLESFGLSDLSELPKAKEPKKKETAKADTPLDI